METSSTSELCTFLLVEEISPLYQSILRFQEPQLGLGAASDFNFELFLGWITRLMEVYQTQREK